MMWRIVLEKVDEDLAEDLTQILRRNSWDAGHQKSYPVEVMVRTETDEEVAGLGAILERHVIRQPHLNQLATEMVNKKGLERELLTLQFSSETEAMRSKKRPLRKLPMHVQNASLPEVNETFEDLKSNALKVLELFNKYSNGQEIFYLRSRKGGYTIGFSKTKAKMAIKFWIVGRRR